MTDRVKSKYKFLGGFGLLVALNLIILFGILLLATSSKISLDKISLLNDKSALIAYAMLLVILLLFILLLVTQCERIIIEENGITFINPLFPFIRRTKQWNHFDYYITVDEDSRYSTYEAIWLVKNSKINERISSFYYMNYSDILSQVKVQGKGKKYFNPIIQLLSLLRLKRIK